MQAHTEPFPLLNEFWLPEWLDLIIATFDLFFFRLIAKDLYDFKKLPFLDHIFVLWEDVKDIADQAFLIITRLRQNCYDLDERFQFEIVLRNLYEINSES